MNPNPELLLYATWEELIRITQDISTEALDDIMRDELGIEHLSDLTQTQALHLRDCLASLSRLKKTLWDGVTKALQDEQQRLERADIPILVKVDPVHAANIITQGQIDELAKIYIRTQVDKKLFGKQG